MKKYSNPVIRVHICALTNGLTLNQGSGGDLVYYGEAKGTTADFDDINFEENE